MENTHLELAKKMFKYAGLRHHGIQPSTHNPKLLFIAFTGEPQYELWEMSGIWPETGGRSGGVGRQ